MPTVAIVGAGAIGQWLAALLCAEGSQSVMLICRPRQEEALRAGILMSGKRHFPEIRAGLPSEAVDTVVLTMKTFQVEAAVRELADSNLSFQRLITFQNGVGSDDIVVRQWPEAQIWAATTTTAVAFQGDELVPAAKGGLAIAPATPGARVPVFWFGRLGLPTEVLPDAASLKWSKLLLNLTCNATCALLDWMPAQVVQAPRIFDLELACQKEALAHMRRRGYGVVDLPGYPVTLLSVVAQLHPWLARRILGPRIAKGRSNKPPSLLLDMRQGRQQLEVTSMNGAVPGPVNQALARLLTAVSAGEIPWDRFRGKPEALLEACRDEARTGRL